MYHLIIHYSGEIEIKGKNKSTFEKKLVDNIRSAIKKESYEKITREQGRIIISLSKKAETEAIKKTLRNIAGIHYFCFAEKTQDDIESIKKSILSMWKPDTKNFKIIAKKQSPAFLKELENIVSSETNAQPGENGSVFFVEIIGKEAYVYDERIGSLDGLPVGSTTKVIALTSGGIDSPVAAWHMFRRGCPIVLVHFHNYTSVSAEVKNKIIKLAEVLAKYQFKTKLYLVSFNDVQKEIIKYTPAKYRMIINRRFMFRIAEKVLLKEEAKAFVTGDSLSQVASQTLENLNVIYKAANFPVLTPLIGENKEDIIRTAKSIGTYELSILPYQDCCSFLVDKHPVLRARLEDVEKIEENMNVKNLCEESFKKSEILVLLQN